MYNKLDVLPIEGKEYLVIDTLEYDGVNYLYLVNNSDFEDDNAIVKVIYENNKDFVINIDNDDEFNKVVSLFINQNKEELLDKIN